MLTLEQVRDGLQDRSIAKVAESTGLHYNTVRGVRDNQDANPSYRVVAALSQYLQQSMRKK